MDEIYAHEDSRRVLIEWVKNTAFKTAKAVIAKANCIVGDHHHNKKDETFLLLIGNAKRVIIGDREETDVQALRKWEVPKRTYHLFELDEGSILLGVCTKRFDIKDEIKGKGTG
ncbi:hypothetical protein HY469_02670 [Candidatus Roizmanbacteria bacterium]|nr:hypothetical protein [Candidatus Roizmanbacteria bacterium]